jgi:hypothetical protein
MERNVILDLCGGTGAWSRPYVEAGFDVFVATLPKYDVNFAMCHHNFMQFCSPTGFRNIGYESVYGILAAPPCTEFSFAKNGSHRERDMAAGMVVVDACLNIIKHCGLNGNLHFWAMENPRGYLRQIIGKPLYTFEQWWFGDRGIKPTDLWGYYNTPKRTHFERPADPFFVKRYKSGKCNQFCLSTPPRPEWLPEDAKLTREQLRAITPAGFAKAFFEANHK